MAMPSAGQPPSSFVIEHASRRVHILGEEVRGFVELVRADQR
jgi:hypothetical protein